MTTRVVAQVCFGCEYPYDSDGAARALERAGFTVARLPVKYRRRMAVPDDDFIEAIITRRNDDDGEMETMWEEVDALVGPYGGQCTESPHVIGFNYEPFKELFEPGRAHLKVIRPAD
jgi:hypothetical protein